MLDVTNSARHVAASGRVVSREDKVPQARASAPATNHRPSTPRSDSAAGSRPAAHSVTSHNTAYMTNVATAARPSLLANTCRSETGAARSHWNVSSSRSMAQAVAAHPRAKNAGVASATLYRNSRRQLASFEYVSPSH